MSDEHLATYRAWERAADSDRGADTERMMKANRDLNSNTYLVVAVWILPLQESHTTDPQQRLQPARESKEYARVSAWPNLSTEERLTLSQNKHAHEVMQLEIAARGGAFTPIFPRYCARLDQPPTRPGPSPLCADAKVPSLPRQGAYQYSNPRHYRVLNTQRGLQAQAQSEQTTEGTKEPWNTPGRAQKVGESRAGLSMAAQPAWHWAEMANNRQLAVGRSQEYAYKCLQMPRAVSTPPERRDELHTTAMPRHSNSTVSAVPSHGGPPAALSH
ncbi:hypothetical protein WOLCODRAFT_163855 [Wolfiporia cocos MD-104 SS10]|uniref:Uncharacterized protein n=1 Tax=Wolfiporia cocos (strain MD-104) TaxID=742152 RepID=A0A2H3JRJ8_WOLCO|nr:hypothetical protein WOLCODRAFT_163855 [Wolfiporia cocos MD-104 SS10]